MSDEGLEITVEYCVPCSYLARTMWMVGELLAAMQEDIKSLTLIPGDGGMFEWAVNGELVYSKKATGAFPEMDDIMLAVANRL